MESRYPQHAKAPSTVIGTGGESHQGSAGRPEATKAPLPAALSPSSAAAPGQTPLMEDGAFYPTGCTTSSTDARCTYLDAGIKSSLHDNPNSPLV